MSRKTVQQRQRANRKKRNAEAKARAQARREVVLHRLAGNPWDEVGFRRLSRPLLIPPRQGFLTALLGGASVPPMMSESAAAFLDRIAAKTKDEYGGGEYRIELNGGSQ